MQEFEAEQKIMSMQAEVSKRSLSFRQTIKDRFTCILSLANSLRETTVRRLEK